MGRFFLLFFIILFFVPVSPAFARTISHNVAVTATVLPSPEWIQFLQSNSTVSRIDLPFVGFVTYRLRLSDGRNPAKNRLVTLNFENSPVFSVLTDSDGIAAFYIPISLSRTRPLFTCLIADQEIPLFTANNLQSDI
jgi:hypothetical protein